MCMAAPLALASFAINSASALASHQSASENAKTQNLANALNRQAAIADFGRQDAALGKRQRQEADAASARKFDAGLEAQKALATNTVAADEAGITGATVDSLMHDIYAQQGRYDARVDQNLDWTQSHLQDEKTAVGYALKDRVNSLRKVRGPSLVETGLKIGQGALNAAASYQNLSDPTSRSALDLYSHGRTRTRYE